MKQPLRFLGFSLLLGLLPWVSQGQSVGVGTTAPHSSAALEVKSPGSNTGLLIPRLTAAERTGIAAPSQGLLVYQTDGSASGGPQSGFWYYAGSPAAWVFLNPTGGADNLGNHTATQNLSLQGNALTGAGASIGAAVGMGVTVQGGLNIAQNTTGNNLYIGYQSGQANTSGSGNHFEGYRSGYSNTTGTYNHFVGRESGFYTSTGTTNQFTGAFSGYLNTVGSNNHFDGFSSGYYNTSGAQNHFNGKMSGFFNSTGNRNTFIGMEAGLNNSTGSRNLFLGTNSGSGNTTGSFNHFVGYESGLANTASGTNHFEGYQSGYSNSTGSQNLFQGFQSGYSNTTGSFNHFTGMLAGSYNTTGTQNFFEGYSSGNSNTTGNYNQFSGYMSGFFNTTGANNLFTGRYSGYNNDDGLYNHFDGMYSGYSNYNGDGNQCIGYRSGYQNAFGNFNMCIGYEAGYTNGASENTYIGYQSGYSNYSGSGNVFLGFFAGQLLAAGSYNVYVGHEAGPAEDITNLTNSIAIGHLAQVSQSNSLALGGSGSNAVNVGLGTGAPASRLHVYSTSATQPAVLRLQSAPSAGFGSAGLDLYSDPQGAANEWRPAFLRSVDAGNFTGGLAFYTNGTGFANKTGSVEGMRLINGQLGIGTASPAFTLDVNGSIRCVGSVNTTSDARLKQDIRPVGPALVQVQRLRGVRYTFRRAEFPAQQLPAGEQIGLLAQELEQVYPELVSTDKDGYKAVNYAQLTPVLLEAIKELAAQNEALRHRAGQAEAAVAGIEQRLRALEAGGERAAEH